MKVWLLTLCIFFSYFSFAQNVGIGTTTPGAQLHIYSSNVLDTPRGAILMSRYWAGPYDARASAIYHFYDTVVSRDQLIFGVSGDGGNYISPTEHSNAKMVIEANGNVGIGTTTPNVSAVLDISSTSKGFLPPRMDINQRNTITALVEGLTIYNTTTRALEFWNGSQWYSISPATQHYIGESYGGGTVFYIYDGGHHGLIAATADQSIGIQWYNGIDRSTGATGDGLGAGLMNTSIIIASQMADNQTGNFAAKVCADYSVTVGGITYGDWYFPSKYELNLLYLQKNVVGGFASSYYWSSNESGSTYAWYQNFSDGTQHISPPPGKPFPHYVRAIRAF